MFHQPVLLKEVLTALQLRPNDTVIDATIGGGGHAEAILEATSPQGRLIGLDLDSAAIDYARQHLKKYDQRLQLIQDNFKNLKKIYYEQFSAYPIRAILLDLGVSSYELEDRSRGFSFLDSEQPLDMRFGRVGPTAADILNQFSEKQLTQILTEYGQEIYTRQIAAEIVQTRQKQKILKVGDLTAAVLRVYTNQLHSHKKIPWTGRRHPATRVFLALRLAVNQELDNLRSVLPQTCEILSTAGRLAVITFQSLEDRIVKDFFRTESRNCICPPALPVCRCGHQAKLKIINRRAIRPNQLEVKVNPRSRSAQLRVAEKI